MRVRKTYVCDVCRKTSDNPIDIVICECEHLGITADDLYEWKRLKKEAAAAGQTYYTTHNEVTDKHFSEAVKALVDFEKEHDLVDKRVPANL